MAKTVQQWLKARLTGLAAVTAVPGCRVYPVFVPQRHDFAAAPALVYRRTRTQRDKTLKATATRRGSTGLPTTTFRLVAVGYSYDQACALLDAVRLDLEGYHNLGDLPAARDPEIRKVSVEDEADDFEEPDPGDQQVLFTPYLDVEITSVEVTP